MKKRARQAHRGEMTLERELRLIGQARRVMPRQEPWEVGPPDWWLRDQQEYQAYFVQTNDLSESRHG